MPGYFPNIQLLRDIAAPGGGGGAVYDPTRLTTVWEGAASQMLGVVLQPGWYCLTLFIQGGLTFSIPIYKRAGEDSQELVMYGSGDLMLVYVNSEAIFIDHEGSSYLKKIEKIG